MIEAFERAPLRVRRAEIRGVAAPRAGSVLALPLGEIAGDFRPLDARAPKHHATYELIVSNDTPLPLATFAYAVESRRSATSMTWNAIVVPPYSAIALAIDVALPRRGRTPRVIAELHSENAQLTLDAVPPQRPLRTLVRRAASVASGLVLLCAGAATVAQTQPHVVSLAAPDTVRAGTPFSVAYALGDSADAEYVVERPDGMQVRRGRLPRNAGAFTVALPQSNVSSGFDVRVFARGPFGTDTRTTHVVALPVAAVTAAGTPHDGAPAKPDRASQRARIGALSLVTDEVRGGEPIVVDYRTRATVGSVRLIDELGTVRAEALLNHRGRSILVAPFTDADQDLRVVVTSERGSARDEAAVPVRVLRTPPTTMLAPEGDGSQPRPQTQTQTAMQASSADGDAPVAVPATADAGAPLVVRVLRHEPALHVSLVDATGVELAASDVPPGASSVTLATPGTKTTTRASVVTTFAKGFGQETVIRPVTLHGGRTP